MLTLYAVYSQSLFDENSWTAPKTWDEAKDLGAKAKAKGKYFVGQGGGDLLPDARRRPRHQGGRHRGPPRVREPRPEVLVAADRPGSSPWASASRTATSSPAAPHPVHGGPGPVEQRPAGAALPLGSWIENEMKKATKDGFKMTGVPEMVLTSSPKLLYESLRSASGEPFIVPKAGKNVAGGKELLRHAVQGRGDELHEDQAGPDHRQGSGSGRPSPPRCSRRRRCSTPPARTSSTTSSSPATARKGHAGGLERLPVRSDRRRRADQRSPPADRQGGERPVDPEGEGHRDYDPS